MGQAELNEYIQHLLQNLNLPNWMQFFSITTWHRIELLKNIHSRISETTITENLVYEFNILSRKTQLPIEIYIAKDEKANGNDLEIFIETKAGYLLMPCQAKIIKENYKYYSISHTVGGTQQIDLLLEYAKKKKGLAAYLFYNFSDHFFLNWEFREKLHYPIECLGCSIADAKFIKSNYFKKRKDRKKLTWKIPSFYELHPDHAMPLYFLGHLDSGKWFPFEAALAQSQSIKFYTQDEIDNDPDWKEIIERAAIGRINLEKTNETKQPLFSSKSFNPKFRIVLSLEAKPKGLFHLS